MHSHGSWGHEGTAGEAFASRDISRASLKRTTPNSTVRSGPPLPAEKDVHSRLDAYRDSAQKEFFRAPIKIVIKAMHEVEEEMA